jgi:hypothetical protein
MNLNHLPTKGDSVMKNIRSFTLPVRLMFAILFAYLRSWLAPASFFYLDPRAGDENTINHYVNKFDDDLKLTFQQKQSRLEGSVVADYSVVGAAKSFDTLGQSEMQLVTGQNQDMQSANIAAGRRWIDLADYDWHDFVNTFDKLKILEDPTNKYVQLAVAAGNRSKDRIIINALGGNARVTTGYGNNLVTSYAALPAEQRVLANGENITFAKLTAGLEILLAAEVADPEDDGGALTFVYTASQLTVLMNDVRITNNQYNSLEALRDYKINTFMGMTWKRVELLPKTAAGVRSNYIYAKNAVGLGVGEDVKTDISQRKDKRGLPWQVYAALSAGAVRGQDNGVVEIQCQE